MADLSLHEVIVEQTDSTMDEIRRLDPLLPHTLLVARRQNQGRGRQGKLWFSGEGCLTCTLMLPFKGAAAQKMLIAPMAGLALLDLLSSWPLPWRLKWPNDLLLDEKKCAGLLVEGVEQGALVGLGVNLNFKHWKPPAELNQAVTSLADFGVDIEALPLARRWAKALIKRAAQFQSVPHKVMIDIRSQFVGERLPFYRSGGDLTLGVLDDIDLDCAQLRLENGRLESVPLGHLASWSAWNDHYLDNN